MYYLSQNDICTAFNTLRKQIDNRLIGILGVLQAIDTRVEDNHTYEVQDERIARWYDKVLYFSDGFEEVSTARTHFVKFSKQWKNFVANSFLKESPNIYHLISVVYFYYGWKNKPTHEELLSRFIADFHIDEEVIKQMFDTSKLPLLFEDSLEPKRIELKSKLGLTGETFSFDIRGGSIQARPSQLSRAPFFQTLYSGIECLECLLISNKDIEELYPTSRQFLYASYQYFQKIFFGTPGSGKSHRVKELTEGKRVHRTTFHPDSDYASFVGCYKPTMSPSKFDVDVDELLERLAKEDTAVESLLNYRKSTPKLKDKVLGAEFLCNSSDISYTFTPQVFTEAYIDAWKKQTDPSEENKDVYLVIEEINRGNCAQIFGDLFQLLDRKVDGSSDYRIKADSDLRSYLTEKLGENHEGIQNGELCLPPNLHILATMNTSDQSLFPMDSAFKRRWDWEYVPVDYSESVPSSRFIITLGDKQYRWVDFLREVNERIRKATDSEDKQMGNFFIKANVSEEQFKSKVMFYLWNEVCRDEYGTPNNFFRISQDSEFSFNDLYQTDGLEKLQGFMAYLGVASTTEETDQAIEEPTEA